MKTGRRKEGHNMAIREEGRTEEIEKKMKRKRERKKNHARRKNTKTEEGKKGE